MADYTVLGLNSQLFNNTSLAATDYDFVTALEAQLLSEESPYLNQTAISKGTIQANLGGVLELRDTTGGTILLTADPKTGTVTIGGPLQANVTLNLGTISNTTIAGQGTISGTVNNLGLITNGTWNNGILGTPAVTGGTLNPTLYQIGGTAGVDATLVYVKTVNFAGSTTTLGTITINKGIITSAN